MATTHAKILGSDEIKIYCPSAKNGDFVIFPAGYMINKVLLQVMVSVTAATDTITVLDGIEATVGILDTPATNEYIILNRSMFSDIARTGIFTENTEYVISSTAGTEYDITYYLTKI